MSNSTVLGIDIGGTNTKLGLVEPDGSLRRSGKIPTDARGTDPAPFFRRLFAAMDALAGEPGLLGIGVSTHGEIDRERRRSIIPGNAPAIRNYDMRGAIEERYGLPVSAAWDS